ncbi:MAG: DUF882 domain-containing protein [Elusimicrobiales bacterium]
MRILALMAAMLAASPALAQSDWRAEIAGLSASSAEVPDTPEAADSREAKPSPEELAPMMARDFGIPLSEAKIIIAESEDEMRMETDSQYAEAKAGKSGKKPGKTPAKQKGKCSVSGKTQGILPGVKNLLCVISGHFHSQVYVSSGLRTRQHNEWLRAHGYGAAKESLHLRGMAADIGVSGVSPSKVQAYAKSLGAGGVGSYPTFTHVDIGPVRYW